MTSDLVIHNKDSGKVTIIEVMIPFEGDINAFDKARNKKAHKYSPLVTPFQDLDHIKNVSYDTFIVGGVGS